MSHESNLKPIPRNSSKEKIHEIFTGLAYSTVKAAISKAIEEVNRERGTNFTQRIKLLNSFHIDKIFQELGDAPGYESINTPRLTPYEIAGLIEKTITEIQSHKQISPALISEISRKNNVSENHIKRILTISDK